MSSYNVYESIRKDPNFHNTWKLLRSYRNVVWSLELGTSSLKNSLKLARGSSIDDFLDALYLANIDLGGTNIESQARTLERTRKMLAIVDGAIEMMRTRHQFGETYYWVIYYTYLTPQKITRAEEIVEKLLNHVKHMSYRTYYRKKREAVETLSSILWGYTTRDNLELLQQFVPEDTQETCQ